MFLGNSHKHEKFKDTIEATFNIYDIFGQRKGIGEWVKWAIYRWLRKNGLYTAENFCQAIQKQWDMGYLANRPGLFLTKARVKIFKMIKPRLPS